jgi:protease-4
VTRTARGALAALLAAGLFAFTGCEGRPRNATLDDESESPEESYGAGSVAELDLTGGAPESTDAGGLLRLPASRTYVGLMRTVERVASDDDATGLFVRIGGQSLGFARTEELGRVLGSLRKKKPVVCHAHDLDNASAWLAVTGCDRIWLSPAGGVSTVGIGAQLVYVKGLLDKLSVQADILAVGKYKSAAESLTREGPSDAAREALTATLGSMRKAWLDGVSGARKAPSVKDSLEGGPWTPREALERGLVDAIGFESEALEDTKRRAKAGHVRSRFGPRAEGHGMGVAEIIRILAGADEGPGGRPHVAVVPAEGGITMEPESLFGSGITAKALTRTLRKLGKDDAVKAVVLRIDSPGGSPLASDLIWHQVMDVRKNKPVVVSVGDMAASGGYYIACAANRIVAERTSIVGSIGVFGGKVVVGPALDKIGVSSLLVPASPDPGAAERAGYLSPLIAWDDATRQRVLVSMQGIYDLFVKRVSEGRKLPEAKVREHAEGRIWSGEQGKERGLVDELGGVMRALSLARELAHLAEDVPVTVEGVADSLLETLMLGENAESAEVAAALARAEAQRSDVVRALPARLRAAATSLSPLLRGEQVITALPYALDVR